MCCQTSTGRSAFSLASNPRRRWVDRPTGAVVTNVADFIEIFRLLHVAVRAHCDMKGLGLETWTCQLGIAERVSFHDGLQNPYPAMARSAVIALCSTYEGFSNAVLEAMAVGTPVITSYCSTDAEQMAEVGAALGFPVGDHAALESNLRRVLTDEPLRRRLADRASQYMKHHTLPFAIAEYEALVRDAISRRASARM